MKIPTELIKQWNEDWMNATEPATPSSFSKYIAQRAYDYALAGKDVEPVVPYYRRGTKLISFETEESAVVHISGHTKCIVKHSDGSLGEYTNAQIDDLFGIVETDETVSMETVATIEIAVRGSETTIENFYSAQVMGWAAGEYKLFTATQLAAARQQGAEEAERQYGETQAYLMKQVKEYAQRIAELEALVASQNEVIVATAKDGKARNDELERTNAQLLEALKECRRWIGDGECSDGLSRDYWTSEYAAAVDRVDAAIASAEVKP